MNEKLKDVKLKPIPIKLDKTRNIMFDWNAVAELVEIYGDTDTMFERIGRPSLKDLQTLLWASLLHELPDPEVDEKGRNVFYDDGEPFTIRRVGKMLSFSDLTKINMAIFKQLKEIMPQPGEIEAMVAETESIK